MPILNLFQPPRALAVGKTPILYMRLRGHIRIALTMSTYFAYISIYIYRRIYHSQPLQCKNSKLDFELMNFFNSTLGHPWQLVPFASQSLSCTVKVVKLKKLTDKLTYLRQNRRWVGLCYPPGPTSQARRCYPTTQDRLASCRPVHVILPCNIAIERGRPGHFIRPDQPAQSQPGKARQARLCFPPRGG